MKLLLTSDLHRDGAKLLWLLDEAPAHDALLVAGDLLDIFSSAGLAEQSVGALRWREAVIATGKSFAWCSGNHDFFPPDNPRMSGASPLWMKKVSSSEAYVTDGETRILHAGAERIAISSIPWAVHGRKLILDGRPIAFLEFVKDLLHKGKELQAKKGIPWIILCHEPPGSTPLSATSLQGACTALEVDFASVIQAWQPDFSLHGHIHDAPTAPDGSWICQIGKTVCFNPGQSFGGQAPQYILLDWRGAGDWTAIWHGDGRTSRADCGDRAGINSGRNGDRRRR